MGEDHRTYADRRELATTDMQERFALGLAAGLSQTEAARVAGYADPRVAGVRLSRSVAVRAVVKAARVNRLDKLASLSLRELEALIKDRKISPAVRFNAIKLSLALAGHTENAPDPEANTLNKKDISAMSIEELDAFLAAERSKRAQAAKPIIDQVSAQPTPNPLMDNDIAQPFAGSAMMIEGEATPIEDSGQDADLARAEPLEPDPTPGGHRPERAAPLSPPRDKAGQFSNIKGQNVHRRPHICPPRTIDIPDGRIYLPPT